VFDKKRFIRELTRREFLKTSLVSICSLCVAGNSACTPERDVKKVETPGLDRLGFINPKPATWFSSINQGKVRCELCPHLCVLAESERARCRVRENRMGVGYTLAYGNPALVQEDPVERKPFYHVVPGSRAVSIATAGCNLACDFCEVWDMALVQPEDVFAYDMPAEKIIDHAISSNVRAISYAFGEPVVFYEYMLEVADLAREMGLLNLIHTAGYIQPEPLKELCKRLDAANVDLKSFDAEFYEEIVGGDLTSVLTSLKLLRESGVHIEITNIVIPTLNDNMDMIFEMCTWIARELGADVPVHFARFYPLYRLSGLPRTPVSTLDQARKVAMQAGLKFVYIAKVPGHDGENTFCHECGKTIIKRVGYVVDEIMMEDGHCHYCSASIPGRWM
jgi:pyruvate formate lyase activating enzyme